MDTAVELRDRKMNQLEERFERDYLAPLLMGREVQWYEFEPMRFRLGGSAFYRPDFVAIDKAGQVIAHEVKGHWREAARARIKIAAGRFPWVRFYAWRHDARAGWSHESFEP